MLLGVVAKSVDFAREICPCCFYFQDRFAEDFVVKIAQRKLVRTPAAETVLVDHSRASCVVFVQLFLLKRCDRLFWGHLA